MFYTTMQSPLGTLTIAGTDTAIHEIHVEGDRYFETIPEDWIESPYEPLLMKAVHQLTEYFHGDRQTFDLPLEPTGTPFQQKVWKAVYSIEYGMTTSYSVIAQVIDEPKAVRAVGTAVGRNPICIVVPCHRVLTNAGQLGGYVAGTGRKQQLLTMEQGAI